jgi:branched-chain amino acid transport system permease protein/urea transport system permease protein
MTGTDILNVTVAAVFTVEVALGLTIIFGVMRVINMAHGEFFMLGAYTMVVVTSAGLSPWLGIALAPVVLWLFGLATERVLIRPLYQRNDLSSLLATFGLSIILQQSVRLIFGPQSQTVPNPLPGAIAIFGTVYPAYRLVAALISLAVIIGVGLLIYRSTFGIRIRATMQNPEAARSLGTNTTRVSASAFALGAALAGLAGALMAPFVGVVSNMGLEQTVRSFLVVIIGGLGSITGTFGGGAIVGGGETALSVPLGGTIARVAILAFAIFIMLVRPRGIFAGRGPRQS